MDWYSRRGGAQVPPDLYGLLRQLVSRSGLVMISCFDDGTVNVSVVQADTVRTCCGLPLDEALMDLAGATPVKSCRGPCGAEKPLTQYSRDATKADGRCDRCKACERRRVRDYKAARRGERGPPAA